MSMTATYTLLGGFKKRKELKILPDVNYYITHPTLINLFFCEPADSSVTRIMSLTPPPPIASTNLPVTMRRQRTIAR
ncbi:hypothetical protein HHX47_DHR5001115 [Lentinula edodes]|nr:hypothetical protein HHX47_DHR5001115 [Lentinula edodes]